MKNKGLSQDQILSTHLTRISLSSCYIIPIMGPLRGIIITDIRNTTYKLTLNNGINQVTFKIHLLQVIHVNDEF